MVKLVHDLEKLNFKTRKCKPGLEFLNLYVENNIIPKFIQFCLFMKQRTSEFCSLHRMFE